MEEERDISAEFKKSKKPAVPNGFFENFYAGIKDEIDAADAFAHLSLKKRPKPGVTLSPIALPAEPVRKAGRIFRLGAWSTATAAAAAITILFYVNRGDETSGGIARVDQFSSGTTAKPLENEVMDAYVAYLDEEELIDFIIENEISTGDELNDDIYDLVESDIEDIYLDL